MGGHVIDGERWIAERLRFLREQLLRSDLSADERRSVEAEIESLSNERGISISGFRWPRVFRRLLRTLRRLTGHNTQIREP